MERQPAGCRLDSVSTLVRFRDSPASSPADCYSVGVRPRRRVCMQAPPPGVGGGGLIFSVGEPRAQKLRSPFYREYRVSEAFFLSLSSCLVSSSLSRPCVVDGTLKCNYKPTLSVSVSLFSLSLSLSPPPLSLLHPKKARIQLYIVRVAYR